MTPMFVRWVIIVRLALTKRLLAIAINIKICMVKLPARIAWLVISAPQRRSLSAPHSQKAPTITAQETLAVEAWIK